MIKYLYEKRNVKWIFIVNFILIKYIVSKERKLVLCFVCWMLKVVVV